MRDGIVFIHTSTSRLGFENALALLPKGPGGRSTRQATNLPDMTIKVRTTKQGDDSFASIIATPAVGHQNALEGWIHSPAINGGELSSDPKASDPIEWLVLSGHGSGGGVWGDNSGDYASVEVANAFIDNAAKPRSGRLKCVLIPSCNNVHDGLGPLWLPMFDHPQPVYLLLGYEATYSGGATGAKVMASFVHHLSKRPKDPIIDAWRAANEKRRQPWAAFAAKGAEKMNLDDWINDKLPKLSEVKELLHFNEANPGGVAAILTDQSYEVRWVMDDGTVLDLTNNGLSNPKNGLFDGKSGKVRIKALQPDLKFKKGDEAYLFVYLYRSTKPLDIDQLLEFDASLRKPHPDTGKAVVNPEKGRSWRPEDKDHVDSFRIVVPADTDTIELEFKIKSNATAKFKADGPGGTHGRFLLDFVAPGGWEIVDGDFSGWNNSYAATAGALLRK